MNLTIYSRKLEKNEGYIAMVDWTKHDGGEIETPSAVKYGDTKQEAYNELKNLLEAKGHTILL